MSGLGSRILRATGLIAGSGLAVAGIGFLKHLLGAFYFGTSQLMDAYLIALVVPDLTMALARTGVHNMVPLYAEERTTSEAEGWRAVGNMITYWLILLLVLTAMALLFSPILIHIVAPGFAGAQKYLTHQATRILFLMALTVGAAQVFAAILYSHKKFLPIAGSKVAFQIGSTFYLVAFHDWGIWSLAWGMVFGGLCQLLVVSVALRPYRSEIRTGFGFKTSAVRKMVRLTLPLYVGASGAKLGGVVSRAFASMLPVGAVSSLNYAFMILETPITIVAHSVADVLFPFLSQQLAERNVEGANSNMSRALVSLSVLFFPLSVGTMILAKPVVRVLLERGSFDAHSTNVTAMILQILAFCIWATAVNYMLTMYFQANQNTLTPTKIGLVRVGVQSLLCVVLVPTLGIRGLAIASAVPELLKTVLLLVSLKRLLPQMDIGSIARSMGRLSLPVATMALVVYQVNANVLLGDPSTWLGKVVVLSGMAVTGVIAYVVGLWVFCSDEFTYHMDFLKAGLARHRSLGGEAAFQKAK